MRLIPLAALALAAFVIGLFVPPAAAGQRGTLNDECVRAANRESCDKLGDLLERGDLSRRFPDEAGLYFALACEQGLARSCARAQASARRYSDYETFEVDAGCMLKHSAFACEEVADARRDEQETEAPEGDMLPLARARMRRALDLYLAGCDRFEAESCLGASRVYDSGFGVAWNPREARAKEAVACRLGLLAACEQQGDHLVGAEAIAPYREACVPGGSPHACLKLARAYELAGAGTAVVAASYREACGRLAFDACAWVARSVDNLDAESPAVVEAFHRWCEAGSPRACKLERIP